VNGALVSDRTGHTTAYALFNLEDRGVLFVGEGEEVYEGMVVGENNRQNDLNINVIRGKKLTNIRAAGSDENIILTPPRRPTLESSLAWIAEDEVIEVTPKFLRVRKRMLDQNKRSIVRTAREDEKDE
jgi:GTP-binding protein